MTRIYYTLFLSFFFWTAVNAQQLPHRNAFATADFIWNPAITAVSEYLDWGITYRQQWLGFEGAPSTATAHFQFPFINNNMSAGAWAMVDEAGPLQNYQAGGSYAYKLNLGYSGQISIGLSAHISQLQFDGQKLPSTDIRDPLLLERRSTALAPNAGLGIFYVSNTEMYTLNDNGFFIGIGSQQLLSSTLSFDEEVKKFSLTQALHANALIGARFINGFSFFEPSLWVDYAQKGLLYARGNILFEQEDTFWAGGSMASDYSLSVQGGLILSNWLGSGSLRIGGMGTYNIGTLGQYQGAGFEVMVVYRYWR